MPEIGQGFIAKPLQRPHPPIVVTAVSPYPASEAAAAARGWDAIPANFLLPLWVKTHWPKYQESCAVGGRVADPTNWRVAKSLCVADDLATARRYATEPNSPYRQSCNSLFTKLKANGRLILFKTHVQQPDDEVTLDTVCEKLVIWARRTRSRMASWHSARRSAISARCSMRQGLGRPRARPPLHDPGSRAGDSAGKRRDRDPRRGGVAATRRGRAPRMRTGVSRDAGRAGPRPPVQTGRERTSLARRDDVDRRPRIVRNPAITAVRSRTGSPASSSPPAATDAPRSFPRRSPAAWHPW
jgi:hypothetical protein